MYKKYINKGGKRIGPYYYESIRLKSGKIKTVYLGRDPESESFKKKLASLRKKVTLIDTSNAIRNGESVIIPVNLKGPKNLVKEMIALTEVFNPKERYIELKEKKVGFKRVKVDKVKIPSPGATDFELNGALFLLLGVVFVFGFFFLQDNFTGYSVGDTLLVGVSESAIANLTTSSSALSNYSSNSSAVPLVLNILNYSCSWNEDKFRVCETIEWGGGNRSYGYITGGESLKEARRFYSSPYTYCQDIGNKSGNKAVNAYLLNEVGKTIKSAFEKVDCAIGNDSLVVVQEGTISEVKPVQKTIAIGKVPKDKDLVQYGAVIGQPVKWKKKVKVNRTTDLEIKLPKGAKVLTINKVENGSLTDITNEVTRDKGNLITGFSLLMTGFAILEESNETVVIIEQEVEEIEIEYETPGPQVVEEDTEKGKRITVSSETHYENILTFTSIPDAVKESIKLYWIVNGTRQLHQIVKYQDTDNSGLIDRIEWVTPHLSNQTFEIIIEITKASHLDSNYNFISDIYNETITQDGIWSEPINHSEYIRVTFEQELDSTKDITIYPRNVQGLNTSVEVYYFNSSTKITEFPVITDTQYYKVYLSNMTGEHDTFDLKIVNKENLDYAYLEFDLIIDPQAYPDASGGDIGATACRLGSQVANADTFDDACSGGYPGACGSTGGTSDFLCDGGGTETTAYNNDVWGTIHAQYDNTSISTCTSVGDVWLCHDWWVSANDPTTCIVKVSDTQNTSFTNVDTSCPGTSSGGLTCVNISEGAALGDPWRCDHFFNGTSKAVARIGVTRTSKGGADTMSIDALFFNVTYHLAPDVTRPSNVNLSSPTNATSNISTTWRFDSNATDSIGVVNATLYHNISGSWLANQTVIVTGTTAITSINVSNVVPGGYIWNVQWCDSTGNCNQSNFNNTFTVEPVPDNPPNVTLLNPLDSTSNVSDSHIFNATLIDDFALVNATLYHDINGTWAPNQTQSRSGTNTTAGFSVANLDFGTYIWNIQTCDNSSQCNQADTNFTVSRVNDINCGDLSVDTIMNKNLTAPGGCFNITANDVTLDCNGNNITYATAAAGTAITAENQNNLTIKNCNIFAGTGGVKNNYAINFSGTNNSLIRDNVIVTKGGGTNNAGVALINHSNNNLVTNNSINVTGSGGSNDAVFIYYNSRNNNITHNRLNTSGTNDNYGVRVQLGINNTIIYKNTINTGGSLGSNYGVITYAALSQGPEYVNVSNNIITTSGTTTNIGISMQQDSANNVIEYNKVNTSGTTNFNYGIWLVTRVKNITVVHNVINTSGSNSNVGLALQDSVNDTYAFNNSIRTGGASGGSNYGVSLNNLQARNRIISNNVSTSGGGANNGGVLLVNGGVANNNVSDNVLYTSGAGGSNIGIWLQTNSISNTLILNNTINTTGTAGNQQAGIWLEGADGQNISHNRIHTGGASLGHYGIRHINGAADNFEEYNNITTTGPANLNFGISLNGAGNDRNLINNNIINSSGASDSDAIGCESGAAGNNLTYNNLTTTSTTSSAIIHFNTGGCDNMIYNNTVMFQPTIWMAIGTGSTNNDFINTTFVTSNGAINFPGTFSPGVDTIDRSEVNISFNRSFVNLATLSYLNQSADLKLYLAGISNPILKYDSEDDGTYINCPANKCSFKSYDDPVVSFNVSSWSSYAVEATLPVSFNQANDVSIALLNETTGLYVVAYCDSSDDSARYRILYTNGTAYNSEQTIDSAAGTNCRIDVSPLNDTAFVIAYADWSATATAWNVVGYDINDNQFITLTTVDADTNANVDVGICALNSTDYATVVLDDTDDDATFAIYNLATQKVAQTDVDTTAAPDADCLGHGCVDCIAAPNNGSQNGEGNNWAFVWYDQDNPRTVGETAESATITAKGSIINLTRLFDANENASVAVGGMPNNSYYVTADCTNAILPHNPAVSYDVWNASTGGVFGFNTSISGMGLTDTNISDCGGGKAGTKIAVTGLNNSQRIFARDESVGDFLTLQSSSNTLFSFSRTLISTTPDALKALDINGYDPNLLISPCKWAPQPTFIAAYNNGSNLVVEKYLANGSNWDGICLPQEDGPPENITLISPPNEVVNASTSHVFFSNASDDVNLSNATLYHNINGSWVANQTNSTITDVFNQTFFNIANIASGNYTWNVQYCDNSSRCKQALTNFTFTVNNQPTIASVDINFSDPTLNTTEENITTYPRNVADLDGNKVKNITDWRINDASMAALYLPFEGGSNNTFTKDYSTNNHDLELGVQALYRPTAGIDGFGAYNFTGAFSATMNVSNESTSTAIDENLTIMAWISSATNLTSKFIVEKGSHDEDNYGFYIFEDDLAFEYNNTVYQNFNTTTGLFAENTWYHVAVTANATSIKFYVNGNNVFNGTPSEPIAAKPQFNTYIGKQNAGGNSLAMRGIIDEVYIFNRTLTSIQIRAYYNNETNLIVANETRLGEVWSACVTPADLYEAGPTVCTTQNATVIALSSNEPPPVPDLLTPQNNNVTTNRTMFFNWSDSIDPDGDPVNYTLNITCIGGCASDNRLIYVVNRSNYTLTSPLKFFSDDNYYYNWTVNAYDGTVNSSWNSSPYKLNISVLIDITVPSGNVSFGDLTPGVTNDTTDDSPTPFTIQNNGNLLLDLNISGTDIWSTDVNPTSNYRYKVDNVSGENVSFEWANSNTSFTNVPATTANNTFLIGLNWTDITDSAEVDIELTPPNGEPSGFKSSVLRFWAQRGE